MTNSDTQAPDEVESQDNTTEEQNETGTLPIDFCPDMTPKEGDTFTVKVVSVDSDNGSMDVVYVPRGAKSGMGIKQAAQSFDNADNTGDYPNG
jgi:hypothetical protein